MKDIWRKCLGLSVGFLIGPAQAAEPPIIASSVPAAASLAPASRPLAVTLGRPRPAAAPAPSIQLTTFRGEGPDEPRPASRPQVFEAQPMPAGAGPTFGTSPSPPLLPMPRPVAPAPIAAAPPPPGFPPPGMPADFATTWSPHGWADHGAMLQEGVTFADGPPVGPGNLFYIDSEYLLWWLRGSRLPPLVTTAAPGPPPPPGALSAGTPVLLGGSEMDTGAHSGYRLRTGLWLNRDHTLGLEGSYFFLAQQTTGSLASSNGTTVLAVPFVNALDRTENAVVLAQPPGTMGRVGATLETRLWGAEANLRSGLLGGPGGHLDLLAGFRTLGLDDNFQFTAASTSLLPQPILATATSFQDRIATRNRFYGGQIGASSEWRWGRLTLDVTGKVALGGTRERVEIGGNQSIGVLPVWTSGGLFARPTNSGTFNRDQFAVVSELGLNLGYQVTDSLRAYAGYTFLYSSNVARPGEQIDRVVNPVPPPSPLIPAIPARPAFAFKGSDFWAHGANVGLEFRY